MLQLTKPSEFGHPPDIVYIPQKAVTPSFTCYHHRSTLYENGVKTLNSPCTMAGDAPIARRVLAMISIET